MLQANAGGAFAMVVLDESRFSIHIQYV